MLEWSKRLNVLEQLGEVLRGYISGNMRTYGFDFTGRIKQRVLEAGAANAWFTEDFVNRSIDAWGKALTTDQLHRWAAGYPGLPFRRSDQKRRIALVMAGNIPMAGMHDLVCCVLTGHDVVAKLSSDDALLLPLMGEVMVEAHPEVNESMTFTTGVIKDFDAVIATGSDNTSRYFEYYFGKYPHIIRKNRNSVAVLTGTESFHELDDLCDDVLCYFGMGCRSVSKLYVPDDYDFGNLTVLFDAWDKVGNHHKYRNNYDYQKAILLLDRVPFTDHRNIMMVENDALSSPLSILHYQRYTSIDEVENEIRLQEDLLQCVVSKKRFASASVHFGAAQEPALWDYADRIDTVKFLLSI